MKNGKIQTVLRIEQGFRIIKCLLLKMASSRENGLSETHASMLHAFCACNYIRLPLTRQHKTSVSVSRFAPLRHFRYEINYNAEARLRQKFYAKTVNHAFNSRENAKKMAGVVVLTKTRLNLFTASF